MRKLIQYITPSFINRFNQYLLTHAPMGWQLQLPVITWCWFLFTLLTIPVPFLYNLDRSGDDDVEGVIFLAVMIAVLQLFLYAYILIQFNGTKSFGTRKWWYGIAEQVSYFWVLMLCMSQIMLYPSIVEYRKSQLMSDEEIFKEAKIFNQARHYFMDNNDRYMYFPDDETFVSYIEYQTPVGSTKYQAEYYNQDIKPMMAKYIISDTDGVKISPRITRQTEGPRLYFVYQEGNSFLNESYSHRVWWEDTHNVVGHVDDDMFNKYKYQLQKKSDAERLEQIKAFIALYNRYQRNNDMNYYYEVDERVIFESPEDILRKYQANQFANTQHYKNETTDYEGRINYPTIDTYAISSVHYNILQARYGQFENFVIKLMVCVHVAVVLSILLFLFKNNRLRDFILLFVYTALLVLATSIIAVITDGEEHVVFHVMLLVLGIGLVLLFTSGFANVFSSMRNVIIMLTNLAISYVPIFIFFYLDQYLKVIYHPGYEFCANNSQYCEEYENMMHLIMHACLWGGPLLYLFIGSVVFKRIYEKQWSLPKAR